MKVHSILICALAALISSACAKLDYGYRQNSDEPQKIEKARELFNREVSKCSTRGLAQMPPIRAFNAGDIYAHWESAKVNNNTKVDIENVEAPINTTYKHIITQMSITGERKRMLCHSKLLVSESISGRTGVFVVWFIPTVEYTETHTGNPAKEFGNDGNMGDYCGLKVYSRLNGSIIRINKYNDGKKIAGVYFPNAKTKLARLSAKTYGDKLLAGISFTMFTKKSSGTRGYDWDEECYDNEMDEDEGGEEEEMPEEGDPDVDFFDEEFEYCYGELEEEIPWDCGELTPAIIVEEIEAEEEELEEVEEVEEIPDEEAFDPNDGVEEEIEELPEDCEEECEEAEWEPANRISDELQDFIKSLNKNGEQIAEIRLNSQTHTATLVLQDGKVINAIHWSDPANNYNCHTVAQRYCKELQEGYKDPGGCYGDNKHIIQLITHTEDGQLKPIETEYDRGIRSIIEDIEKGKPVMVGVNEYGWQTTANDDKVTEHFLVIFGYEFSDTEQPYFKFFYIETGVSASDEAFSYDNHLDYQDGTDKYIHGNGKRGYEYTLTHIRIQ